MASIFSSQFWSNIFNSDLAIDLGTASTLVHTKQAGRIVIYEPSIVAVNTVTHEVEAVGDEAKQLLGRAPQGVRTIRPMKDGMIFEVDAAEKMLAQFISKARPNRGIARTRIVVSVPPRAHQVARRAVKQVCYDAKAGEVFLVDQTMVAAIGAGLAINEKRGCMIVDIGGGTTDIAVISMDGVVYSKAIRVGGDKMDEAIINYIKRKYNLLIGEMMAEMIKLELGSAYKTDNERHTMEIKGRDLVSGIPKTLVLDDDEVRESLAETVSQILNGIKLALENTPPELSADIVDKGIVLAGGGALLKGLDVFLREETSLPIIIAENPLTCVALGAGMVLDDEEILKKVIM